MSKIKNLKMKKLEKEQKECIFVISYSSQFGFCKEYQLVMIPKMDTQSPLHLFISLF